jgi:hypothetical protein
MNVSQGNRQEALRQLGNHRVDKTSSAQLGIPLDEKAKLVSALVAELSACFQMMLMEVALPTDLAVAGRRWVQRLRTLASFIESTLNLYETTDKYAIADTADSKDEHNDVLTSLVAHAGIPDIVPFAHHRRQHNP